MARTDSPSRADSAASTPPGKAAFDPVHDTLPWARDSLTGMLELGEGMSAWMRQCQALGAETVHAWAEALRATRQQAGQARDLQQLMHLPGNLAQRQLSIALQQFSAAMTKGLEAQAQMSERVRHDAGKVWQRVLPAAGMAPPYGDTPTPPLSSMQAEWLAFTQRWLEGLNAGAAARHH